MSILLMKKDLAYLRSSVRDSWPKVVAISGFSTTFAVWDGESDIQLRTISFLKDIFG